MKYSDCPLYGLQSKKMLKRLLHIKDSKITKQDYIVSLVSPYIDKSAKPRLIEPPSEELKTVQKRLKSLLSKIVVPDNVFSGVKGRSYADNAKMHIGNGRRNLRVSAPSQGCRVAGLGAALCLLCVLSNN